MLVIDSQSGYAFAVAYAFVGSANIVGKRPDTLIEYVITPGPKRVIFN